MKAKTIVSLLLCSALLFSAAGCSGAARSDNTSSSSGQEAVEDKQEDAGNITEEAPAEAEVNSDAEAAPEETPSDTAEPAPGAGTPDATSSDAETDQEQYDAEYAFAHVKADGTKNIVIPNGTVGDETVLYNDMTLGGLCDYIDSTVLEDGRTINRQFLYGLISVEVIDPSLFASYEQFSRAMIYSLTIANEFYSIDVSLKDLIRDTAENTKQVFEVVAEGKEDSWILDGHENRFYLNNGDTEYSSTMFDPETMAVWSVVLDNYFGVDS